MVLHSGEQTSQFKKDGVSYIVYTDNSILALKKKKKKEHYKYQMEDKAGSEMTCN